MVRTIVRPEQGSNDFLTENEGETLYGDTTGTFTPVVKIGTTTQTASVAIGNYNKVQDIINVSIKVTFSKSGTGDLTLEGLPFASKNTANFDQTLTQGLSQGIITNLYYGSGPNRISIVLSPNSTTLLFKSSSNTSSTSLSDTDLSSSISITISGSYVI